MRCKGCDIILSKEDFMKNSKEYIEQDCYCTTCISKSYGKYNYIWDHEYCFPETEFPFEGMFDSLRLSKE